MADTLRIKRRLAAGGAGTPASLANAELAYNEASHTLYYGEGTGGSGGTATSVVPIAGPGAFLPLNGGTINTSLGSWSSSNYGKQLLVTGSGNNPAIGFTDNTGANLIGITNAAGVLRIADMPAYTNSTTAPVNLLSLDGAGSTMHTALTCIGGVNFGSVLDSASSSVASHISLFGTQYGLGVTSSRLNYNSQVNHVFLAAGVDKVTIGSAGLTMAASTDITLSRDPTGALMAVTKQYTDVRTVPIVATIAALRAATSATLPNTKCTVQSYAGTTNRGGGDFIYVSTDTTTADDAATIIVDASARRWYRMGWRDQPASVLWWGAVGDGAADDTAEINAAMSWCATNGRVLEMAAGTYMISGSLINPGCSIVGHGRDSVIIAPLASFPLASDLLVVNPASAVDLTYLHFADFMIWPGISGTVRGHHGMAMNFGVTSQNMGQLHIERVFIQPCNGYSLAISNNITANPQGIPSNSVIGQSEFWSGIYLVGIGDSITLRNNVIRGTNNAQPGIFAFIVNGTGGIASLLVIEENNIDAAGGAIALANGRNIKILHNNIEQSAGPGSNGAVIDIDGTSGAIPMCEVIGNAVGLFGTATTNAALRINGAMSCVVNNNNFLCATPVLAAISVTANASGTSIGHNQIGSQFTNKIVDSGTDTRGVDKPLTLQNGFANIGSGTQTAAYHKAPDGTVFLKGMLGCPASPNGLTVTTIPSTAPPPDLSRYFPCYALVSATPQPQGCIVNSTGVITYSGSNSTTQISLDGINYTTQSFIGADL